MPLLSSPPASIVPHPDVRVLRCRTAASGYRNVYECSRADGATKYVAKVKIAGRLHCLPGSRSHLPHVSALAVARWYEDTFGADWKRVARDRKRLAARHGGPPPAVAARWSASRGGWVARAWVDGRPEECVYCRRRPGAAPEPTARLIVCRTERAAVRVALSWIAYRYGWGGAVGRKLTRRRPDRLPAAAA